MTPHPSVVLWELSYACPLRCTHCYSESGVRPSRQLARDEMMEVADALAAFGPRVVHLSGGEPLIVRGLLDVAARLADKGVDVVLTTSGWGLDDTLARGIAELFHSVHVSVDGPDAATHDRVRGKSGSFDAALAALEAFDALSRAGRSRGRRLRFGIDYVVLRSTFDSMSRLILEVVPNFPELEFVIFNGVVPQGLASREGYEVELLTDDQMRALGDLDFVDSLEKLAPKGVKLAVRDNLDLMMHPELVKEGAAWTLDRLIVEPDGMVRALEVYEGHVGDVRKESLETLWQRVQERRRDPLVTGELGRVRSSVEWARATREIDRNFASTDDLVRLGKRKPYVPPR